MRWTFCLPPLNQRRRAMRNSFACSHCFICFALRRSLPSAFCLSRCSRHVSLVFAETRYLFLIVLTRPPLLRFPVPFPKRFPVCLFCKPHRSVRTLTALSSLAVSPPLCIRFANSSQFEKCKLLCLGSYRTYLGSYAATLARSDAKVPDTLLGSASEAKLSERNLGREVPLALSHHSISELLLPVRG